MTCEEAFQNLLKTSLSFGGSFEGCNWRATRFGGRVRPPMPFFEN